jgi:hypothetical protein
MVPLSQELTMYKLSMRACLEMKSWIRITLSLCVMGIFTYLDLVAQYCTDLRYHNTTEHVSSFSDAFERVKNMGNHWCFEFGSDAHALENQEDQKMQAYYSQQLEKKYIRILQV